MTDSMRERTEGLRKEAFVALQQCPEFRAYKALDDAVVAMGGDRQLTAPREVTFNSVIAEIVADARQRRMSQADGAEVVLREQGRPMPSVDLMPAVGSKGVTVSTGPNALINFGSTMSRDKRFYSFRHEGVYYWWLRGVPLPSPFKNEAPDLPLQVGSDASSSNSSQEGGDANAATT
jgi:hypothetical protein